MDTTLDRERLALELLEGALEWPAAERESRLQQELAHDPALLTEVLELLKSVASANESMPTRMVIASEQDEGPPPERLGVFKIEYLIGSGGMGRVFRASRVDGGFGQVVAIKLMRRSRMPALVAEQFARERQILAQLQHRNIAQLFDGGVTADGLSYIVMELVEGSAVTAYAERQQLSLRATLQLFQQICAAVEYAHAHLVVHADIKPNNVIVTSDGSAKLLDFGVAHALADVKEESGRSLGLTFEYASPARREGAAPSTVDDVYSLGVLLEELLKRFDSRAPDLKSVCNRAHADDVDARYASVDALREDLRRWSVGLPVLAHGTHWRYVAGKYLVRHRLAVALVGASLVLLAGAAVALAVLFVRAEHARKQAEERFTDLRDLSHYVLFDVYDRLQSVPRALTLRRDLADAGQRYLDRLAQDPNAPIAVRLEVIEGLRRLAEVQAKPGTASLALVPQAKLNLDRAETLAQSLPDRDADRRTRSLVLMRIALARSTLASTSDQDFVAAQSALDHAQSLLTPLLRSYPNDAQMLALELDLAVERAATLQWQGKYSASIQVASDGLDNPSLKNGNLNDTDALLQKARLLDIYAESSFYAGDVHAAEQPYRDQLALLQKLYDDHPQDLLIARRLQRAGWALGTTLLDMNGAAEAEPILAKATALAERLQYLEPDDRDIARSANIATNAHAQALQLLGRYAEAIPVMERTVNARQRLWDDAPADWGLARDYAMALAALADAHADSGDKAKSCTEYRNVLAVFDRIRDAGRLAKLDEDHSLRVTREKITKYCR